MDYKEKYNAALERAAKLRVQNPFDTVEQMVEHIFPELQESEGEKVRKWLIDWARAVNWSEQFTITKEQVIAWLEKQGEHAEVEPKFHEGEWLCENEPNNYARFIQILETVNVQGKERYRISRDIHNDEDIVEFSFVENYYHKFDIADAKDGDVLFHSDSASNGIFVFKEILQCGTIQKVLCYCDYDSEDGFCLGENHTCCWTNNKILHPATKEQRDLLFQKMADAGYEFVNGHITRF